MAAPCVCVRVHMCVCVSRCVRVSRWNWNFNSINYALMHFKVYSFIQNNIAGKQCLQKKLEPLPPADRNEVKRRIMQLHWEKK